MSLPDLEGWAIFSKVAERRSFSAAAAELRLSKATVSKAVTRLEQRLGSPLLLRSSRRIALTATGEVLAARAARMLEEAEAIETVAREDAAAPSGRVRIATSISFGIAHLGPALAGLVRRHPGLQVELDLSDATVDLIAGGIDVALRIGRLEDSALKARKLCDVRPLLVASPAYLEGRPPPRHPRDLVRHSLFGYTNLRAPGRLQLVADGGETYETTIDPPLAANNADALLPALRQGVGMMLLPDFIVADDLAAGRLVRLLPGWEGPRAGLWLIVPGHGPRPARITAVVDYLVERFAGRR